MGIKGLLPALKEYIQPVHISKYSGKRVSILFFFFDNVSLLWVFRVFFFFFFFLFLFFFFLFFFFFFGVFCFFFFFFLVQLLSLSVISSFIFFFQSTYSLCVSSFCHSNECPTL